MSDYISREAAIDAIMSVYVGTAGYKARERAFAAEEAVRRLPAADVEPVRHERWEGYTHGRFYGVDDLGDPIYRDATVYYCSNMRCRRKTVIKENYCPNCGAKMDGGAKNG